MASVLHKFNLNHKTCVRYSICPIGLSMFPDCICCLCSYPNVGLCRAGLILHGSYKTVSTNRICIFPFNFACLLCDISFNGKRVLNRIDKYGMPISMLCAVFKHHMGHL